MRTLRILNSTCILIVCTILISALYFQFGLKEAPCPLCLLQRMGMMGVIFGLALNIYFGFNAKHFAVVIISAVIGGIFSVRQVLLHIVPNTNDDGYGTPIFGLHLYTWGVFIFLASVIGSSIFLLFNSQFKKKDNYDITSIEKISIYLSFIIVITNVIATFFECQLGPCCENGPCT